MESIGWLLNEAIGQVSIAERLTRIVDLLKSGFFQDQMVKEIICETERIFQKEFSQDERWKDKIYCSSYYFLELFKLLRYEQIYRVSTVGHNIIDDTLDKVLAVVTERLIDECGKLAIRPECTDDVLTVAVWMNAKVSKNHRGKTNQLLRLCGERLNQSRLLSMINLDSTSPDFNYLTSLGNLEAAQNLLALGLALQLGPKKIINQAFEVKSRIDASESLAQEVVDHLQDQIRQICKISDYKKNDEDSVRKDLFTLSKCPGWDMKKAQEWFEGEFPYLAVQPT